MHSFKIYVERAMDDQLRQEAVSIADAIINHINSSSNKWGDGLPYDYSKRAFDISSLVPNHPGLKLKFINQPGFGKNKDSQGQYDYNLIKIALPAKTAINAVYQVHDVSKPLMKSNFRISENVGKFFSKPGNYDTLIHEIIHHLDAVRTKRKVFRNYPDDKAADSAYFQHPSETNAFLQSFLVKLNKYNRPQTWPEVVALLNKEDWFVSLTEDQRRKALSRAYQWHISVQGSPIT